MPQKDFPGKRSPGGYHGYHLLKYSAAAHERVSDAGVAVWRATSNRPKSTQQCARVGVGCQPALEWTYLLGGGKRKFD